MKTDKKILRIINPENLFICLTSPRSIGPIYGTQLSPTQAGASPFSNAKQLTNLPTIFIIKL